MTVEEARMTVGLSPSLWSSFIWIDVHQAYKRRGEVLAELVRRGAKGVPRVSRESR